jgi:hypothetical protein
MAELSAASWRRLIKPVIRHECSPLEMGICGVLDPYKVVGLSLLMHIYSPETHEQTI